MTPEQVAAFTQLAHDDPRSMPDAFWLRALWAHAENELTPDTDTTLQDAVRRLRRSDQTACTLWAAAHGLWPNQRPLGRRPVVPSAAALTVAQEWVNKSGLLRRPSDTNEDAVTRLIAPVVGEPAARKMARRLHLLVEHADILCDPVLNATAVADVLAHRDVPPPSPPQSWPPADAATLRHNIIRDAERLGAM